MSTEAGHRVYKDAVGFVLDASDLYEDDVQEATSSPPKEATLLISIGSNLRSALARYRKSHNNQERLLQERWRKHLAVCKACQESSAGGP